MITPLAALALALLPTAAALQADRLGSIDGEQRVVSTSPIRPAAGRLLVASRNILDPNFAQTVIALLAYDETGALGLVLNRPTKVRLTTALPQLKDVGDLPDVVFIGGPVGRSQMMALFRSAQPVKSAHRVFDDVYVSGNLDALRRALKPKGTRGGVRAYAGSSGWGPRQLDNEIARGDWYLAEGDARIIFAANPAEVWETLIQRVSGEWAEALSSGIAASNTHGVLRKRFEAPRTTADLAPSRAAD
ncbi:MAG TPA: YqgE/AlgH family protein [Candidatus Binatia bacterium]|nr:YqgE/AlgH family protein [Candidatus Binatia bacterium]